MLRLPLIVLLITCVSTLSYSQDSVKKVAAPAKPVVKYKTYKYNTVPAATTPAPGATAPGQTVPVAVKKDSAKPQPPVILDKSLNGQYQYLLTKVYHYQQPLIADFWKVINDSLNVNKHKLAEASAKLTAQTKLTDSLKTEIGSKEQTLNASNAKVDSISFFGIPVEKSAYNIIMFGLVVVFGITAAVVIMRSGSYSREAKYRVKLYNELEEEFKVYKTKANEKEKKLARELQTERNKLDELLGRG